MNNVVIVDTLRTPFARAYEPTSMGAGKRGGLADVSPAEMLVALSSALVARSGIDPAAIETLLVGCVHQEAEQGLNLARLVVLHPGSGLPQSVGGVTLDRFCGSSMQVIADGKNAIAAGEAEAVLCMGVQSISRIPMGGWNPMVAPEIYDGNAKGFMNMGVTAENLAQKYGIDRVAQEAYAVNSHQKAAAAQLEGRFEGEILPIGGVSADGVVRADSSMEKLATLKPAFSQEGTVTAGTSSAHTDGAAGVLLASEDYARTHNLPILARIKSFAGSGCAPEIMGIGPVEASKKALTRAGLTMADMDIVELNEAFAAQCLAVLKEWEAQGMALDPSKLNIDGGSVALGHPLGASGARITGKAARLLQRANARYALATMCIGGGQGVAMVLENPNI